MGDTSRNEGRIPAEYLDEDGVVVHWAPNDVLLQEDRPVWDHDHAAAHLGNVKGSTIRQWLKTGRYAFPFTKVGGQNMHRPSDVVRWVVGRTENIPAGAAEEIG